MSSIQKILLFTCSEYGQANVVLAVAYELALRRNVEVHIASFAPLEKRIPVLQESIESAGSTSILHFHLLRGNSTEEAVREKLGPDTAKLLQHPPGVRGALLSYRHLAVAMVPWTAAQYLDVFNCCTEIIEFVDPKAIVVEGLFRPPADSCIKLGRKYTILSPNSAKDLVVGKQPRMAAIWKYPVVSSGFSYPVPWYQIPLNIYLFIRMIFTLITSSYLKGVSKFREENGLQSLLAASEPCAPDVHHLTPSTPYSDFGGLVIPPNVTLCGPILYPARPVEETDPQMAAWLEKGPTVLINTGTHDEVTLTEAREMTTALRILLNRDQTIRILWKLRVHRADKAVHDTITAIIGKERESGRVKVVDWLVAEPLAILRHPNVVANVNHGGANSFFEAVSTGTPQVVLPFWYDTYEYANRVEWLGIGIYGNRRSAPTVEALELGRALTRIVGDGEEARRFRATAEALRERCIGYTGRVLAAEKVLEIAAAE